MSGFEKLGHRIFTLEVSASALVFTVIMDLNDSKIIKLAGPSQQWCFVWNRETSNQSCINSRITFSAIRKKWALNVEQQKIRPKWFSVRVSGYQCLTSESHFHIPANFYLPQPSALYIFQPLLYFCTIIIKDSFLEMVKSRPKNQRQLVIPGSYNASYFET